VDTGDDAVGTVAREARRSAAWSGGGDARGKASSQAIEAQTREMARSGRRRVRRGGRRRGQEAAAVGTDAHCPDSAFKARLAARHGAGAWQPPGDGALTGRPGAGSGG
jgi:hypothetical protein